MSISALVVRGLLVAVLLLSLSACGTPTPTPPSSLEDVIITGTATYRERMALPEDAVLTVSLVDITTPNTAREVESRRVTLEGRQPPYPFELIVPANRISHTRLYSVRAMVETSDAGLLFQSDVSGPVLTHGAPSHIDIVMRHVGDNEVAPLTGTRWELFELNGAVAETSEAFETPHLILHFENSRFSGSTGINQMGGDYALNGASLTFVPGPMTRRAGSPKAMQLERDMLAALNRVDGWVLHTNTLTLRSGDRNVMRLVAARPSAR